MADYDLVILGGGSAGYAAARTAAGLGLKTGVVDGAEELGGLCILRGCMPSKTLIESANRSLVLRHAAEFGLSAQAGPVDTRFIRDRKRRLIAEFADYRRGQLEDGRFELLRGEGTFEAAEAERISIRVRERSGGERVLIARAALVATGSVMKTPPVPGLEEAGFWTSDTLLDAAEIPESFVVLGGGAIALELAHYLEGIGRRVTLVQRGPQLLTGMDADVAGVVRQAFERRGIAVHCGTHLRRVEVSASGKRVVFEEGGTERAAEAQEILLALGRRPALEGLGLDRIGLERSDGGALVMRPTQQTSHPRIFAAGDVAGPIEVVHLAIQQGEVAARNVASLLGGGEAGQRMDYRTRLFGVFTEPQVAAVGLSELEARAKGIAHRVASYPFADHGKSIVAGAMDGFVKLLADPASGEILGGAVVGPEATELIHEVAVAMHLRATAGQLATAPHYHPTLSEIWTYPAEELAEGAE